MDTVTKTVASAGDDSGHIRGYQLLVEEGPDAGTELRSSGPVCSLGSHPSNGLALSDTTVSRFHCEIHVDADGPRVRDVGSKNGTMVDGIRIADAFLRGDSRIRMGRTVVRFQFGDFAHRLPVSDDTRFGSLVGASIGMRTAFALLERAAASDATVLIHGETGTGKEGAARGIHETSERRERPFVVVDCGAIPKDLVESELFGHERGAFTGASSDRIGAFEEADSGTIFLDEIGELPIDLQPKLLRALEHRQIRRVGSNAHRPIDVRVVAATHRDLRADVNDGRFRPDLYFRIAVVSVTLPPLRERPEDVRPLVEHIVADLTDDPELAAPLLRDEFIAELTRASWAGNVRELRNHLERCLVLGGPMPLAGPTQRRFEVDASMPYSEARQRSLDQFERAYIEDLLRRHDDRVAPAARAAGMNRAYLYRLLQRHGLRGGSA